LSVEKPRPDSPIESDRTRTRTALSNQDDTRGIALVRMKKLRIDVWSDIACPWCYVGKRRLEAALEAFPHRDAVALVWRAFELDPSAPRERSTDVSYAERLATKYGSSVKEAEGMIARMADVARADGLDFHFERARSGNTFDAHRVLHLAHDRGKQDAVKERFLRAYMTEGEPIGDPETLVRLAAEAGLDPEGVRATLASDAYTQEVRGDEAEAREIGINGVPFFVLGGKYAVSGAQPAELLLRALNQAWKDLEANPTVLAEGAVCGPDGCADPVA
jgi:predicted DsbA family dithiol-disulfide isomerase